MVVEQFMRIVGPHDVKLEKITSESSGTNKFMSGDFVSGPGTLIVMMIMIS
jgi:hypothetical protein